MTPSPSSAAVASGPAAPVRPAPRGGAALAGLFVGVVAFLGSWGPSLWSDESATISGSARSLGELWRLVGTLDLVHSFYYLLMHLWTAVVGTGALALRLPSAMFIGLAGACVYLIGVRLHGTALAVAGALVFAVLPRVTWAGIEGRSFALTALLAAAATLALLSALETRKLLTWAGYGALLVLGTMANLFVVLLIGAHLSSLLLRRTDRTTWLRWWSTIGATAVVVSVFLLRSADQAGQLGERTFGIVDLLRNVVVGQWFLGDTPTTTTGVSVTAFSLSDPVSWWLPASILLAAVGWLLTAMAVVAVRVMEPAATDASATAVAAAGGRPAAATVIWALPWMLVPTAVIGLYSLVATPMYSPRYLTFAAPAVALMVGAGLLALGRRWLQVTVSVLLVLLVLPIYLSQRQTAAKNGSDWNRVANYMQQAARPGDGVYFAPRYDVPGDVVGATTRGISVAYPEPFRDLLDVTALETPIQAGDLTGTSARLAARSEVLSDVDTLWMVQRRDYPADDVLADTEFLRAEGFRETGRWTGTLDVVVRFDRG